MGRTDKMITKEIVIEQSDVEILKEFMISKAGRTLDIRTPEGSIIYGVLYQITTEDIDE